jgi:hypothetical protein
LTPVANFPNLRPMRALLASVTLLALAPLACADPEEEDAGAPDSGVLTDTGARDLGTPNDTGIDAAPNDSGGDATTDSGPGDGGVPEDALPGDVDPGMDVEPSDGSPNTGNITIIFDVDSRYNGAGYAVFNDPSGAHIRTRTTTTGVIVETIQEGWMLTIAPSDIDLGGQLTTITNIAPGETYRVTNPVSGQLIADMDVVIGDPYPSADYYDFFFNCGSFGTSDPTTVNTMNVTTDCVGTSTTIGLVAIAVNNLGDRLAFKTIRGVPIMQGGLVQPTEPWRTDFDVSNVSVTNLITDTFGYDIQVVIRDGDLRYAYSGASTDITSGSGLSTLTMPAFGDGLSWSFVGEAIDLRLSWLDLGVTPPSDWTHDMGSVYFPYPGPVDVTPGPTADRPTLTWPSAPFLTMQTLSVISTGRYWYWEILVDENATSFTLPEMAPEIAPYVPVVLQDMDYGLYQLQANWLAGYPGAKELFGRSMLFWRDETRYDRLGPGAISVAAELRIDVD